MPTTVLGVSRLQLVAQNFEIGFLRGVNQAQGFRRAAHALHVGGLHGDSRLSVESQKDGFRVAGQMHFDRAGVAYDDGPVTQSVRSDERGVPGRDAWMDNGTAGITCLRSTPHRPAYDSDHIA